MKTEKSTLEKAIIRHLESTSEPYQFVRNNLPKGEEDSWILYLAKPRQVNLDEPEEDFLPYELGMTLEELVKENGERYREEFKEERENFLSEIDENAPIYVTRVVTRWQSDMDGPLNLVDGTQYYFQYDEEENEIIPVWEDVWEGNQPDYYGGPMDEAKEWVEKCGSIIHGQRLNPYLPPEQQKDSHPRGGYASYVDVENIQEIKE